MIKRLLVAIIFFQQITASQGQLTHVYRDRQKDYVQVKDLITRGEYGLAYPLVKKLLHEYDDFSRQPEAYLKDDLQYWNALIFLKLQRTEAVPAAEDFIRSSANEPRSRLLSFHLAHYYYLKGDYEQAIISFDRAGYDNLDNDQIAAAKFEKAYAWFRRDKLRDAKPLFAEVAQLNKSEYYHAANYYYAFIAYRENDLNAALHNFRVAQSSPEFAGDAAYYVTEIYYRTGRKDEALMYAGDILAKSEGKFDNQLRLILGKIYFERGSYDKALPYLTQYVANAPQVSKDVLYELSYAQYATGKFTEAAAGLRQLSSGKDTLAQNAMYLLGDIYLKAGNKEDARNAFQFAATNTSKPEQQQVARFQYAKLSYELGYADVALRETNAYLASYPRANNADEAREILINLLTASWNFEQALAIYNATPGGSASLRSAAPVIFYGRATEYLAAGDLNKADEFYLKTINHPEAGSRAGYAYFRRGEIAYQQKRYDDALAMLGKYAAASVPARAEINLKHANYLSGYSRFQQKLFPDAGAYFDKVASSISMQSSEMEKDAFIRGADVLFSERSYAAANERYAVAIRAAASGSDYAFYQQAIIAGIKSSSEKIRLLKELQTRYPASSLRQQISLDIAGAFVGDEKYNEALPYLRSVTQSSETALHPAAMLATGTAYYNLNNQNEAIRSWTDLIKKYPSSEEAEDALAAVKGAYNENGKTDDYVAFMRSIGRPVAESEADSLKWAYVSGLYDKNQCGAIVPLTEYISKYPAGRFIAEARWHAGSCYEKNKDFDLALSEYQRIVSLGEGAFYSQASLQAGRISFFEKKDYPAARKYFEAVIASGASQSDRTEALRGLVRTFHRLKDYASAKTIAEELLKSKGISADDKAIASLVLGKSLQAGGDCPAAITAFRTTSSTNRSEWGAEARYEIAYCLFSSDDMKGSEKAALSVIKETGGFDEWVTKAYLLLGDIFLAKKDYFNAKATYESVYNNASIAALKTEAKTKLDAAIAAEAEESKLLN